MLKSPVEMFPTVEEQTEAEGNNTGVYWEK